jgi:FecR protein
MIRNRFFLAVVAVGCALSLRQSVVASPLTSAEVTKIINRVRVIDPVKGGHPAIVREVIKDDLGLRTGEKSRSELLFQDNTLTRIGAETFFSFKTGTRDMTLEKGSMLLQVPKGLGGAKIHTAAVTAAITGTTIMMEYVPDRYIKVLVLEGSLRLSRNGTSGDSLVLRPGKMVIMRPDAKKIPDPVDVDLKLIVKTSTLVNFSSESAPLPSMPLIVAAINDQAKLLATKDLIPTNLVVSGTKMVLASSDQLTKIASGTVGLVANGSLGGSLTGTAVSVSSTSQVLSVLNNATPGSGGTITITPGAVPNVGATGGLVNAGTVGGTVPTLLNHTPASPLPIPGPLTGP